jgi:hypothetical protein
MNFIQQFSILNLKRSFFMAKMFQVYGIGQAIIPVLPPPIAFENPPTSLQTNYEIGQVVYSPPLNPTAFYLYGGAGNWVNATSSLILGTYAELSSGSAPNASYVPSTNDVYTFVNTYASAGGVPATITTPGLVVLATNPEALAGTITTNTAIIPSSLAYALGNGIAIGGTTPGTGAFTTLSASSTLAVTGATTLSAGLSGTTATFSSTLNATGAATFGSTVGVTGTTTLAAVTQVGTASINATGTATTTIGGSSGALTLVAGAGNLAINGGGNTIDIGTDAANTIVIGDATGTASLALKVGSGNFVLDGVAASTYAIGASTTTGTIFIGGTAQTGTITLGSSSGTSSVVIGNGAGASTISLANAVTGAAGVVNVLGGAFSTGTSSFNVFTGTSSGGTQTINLATGSSPAIVNIGNTAAGAVNIKSASTVALSGTTGTTYSIGGSATTGTILIGGTAQTGAITLGSSSGTNSVLIANGAGGTTVSVANAVTGASSVVNVLGGAFSTGTSTFNVFAGTSTGGTQAINLATGSSPATVNIGNSAAGAIALASGGNVGITLVAGSAFTVSGGTSTTYSIGGSATTGTILIGGTAQTGNITLGSSSGTNTILIGNGAGATTVDIANTGTAGNAVNIATSAAANTVAIGSTNTTSTTTLNGGSGGVNVTGANLQIATAGKFLEIKGAAFAATNSIGVGTLSSGTVTIANTNIATGDVILLTRVAANGSTTFGVLTYSISNATSFTVTSLILGTPASTQTADTSTFAYIIVRPS